VFKKKTGTTEPFKPADLPVFSNPEPVRPVFTDSLAAWFSGLTGQDI
jgi:hypothetical protein